MAVAFWPLAASRTSLPCCRKRTRDGWRSPARAAPTTKSRRSRSIPRVYRPYEKSFGRYCRSTNPANSPREIAPGVLQRIQLRLDDLRLHRRAQLAAARRHRLCVGAHVRRQRIEV